MGAQLNVASQVREFLEEPRTTGDGGEEDNFAVRLHIRFDNAVAGYYHENLYEERNGTF